jgi:Uma2 family endonuclease
MAETDVHRKLMLDSLHALNEYFRDNPHVYVSGNIFIYYLDENGQRQSVSPDIFVVFGVEKKDRRIYKLEDEGKAPQVVVELTSTSTKTEDIVLKHYIYANLGVQEYFLFDPYGETIQPALRGFRLKGGEYVPMVGSSLHSEVLGLELRFEAGQLRLYNPKTDERLKTPAEAEAARREAEAARREAEAARREAEAARREAEAARQAAENKAQQESAARLAAETEIIRLREELAKLQTKSS